MNYLWLPLNEVEYWEPLANKLGVSKVARSKNGFLPKYKRYGSDISEEWKSKRNAFIKRHMAQVKKSKEKLFKDGVPTRRHLALIMWAYSPYQKKLIESEIP